MPGSDAERVDLLRALEELKAAAAAARARASVALDRSQRARQRAGGARAAEQGRGVAAQIGLARRESPVRGARYLGLAKVLVEEMPHTLAALTIGRVYEWRATLVARESACLSAEDRAVVDRELAGERLDEVETWGDRRLVAEARRLAYRLDPQAALARVRKAANDRRVSCRPAPETMAYLTALLPVAQAVACYAALNRAADTARAVGDERSRGQVMADTMVELITGQTVAAGTPVEIQLVITDTALFANAAGPHPKLEPRESDLTEDPDPDPDPDPSQEPDPTDEPALVGGYGPVPAGFARELIAELPGEARTWIRRLYTDPASGDLIAMDSRRRLSSPTATTGRPASPTDRDSAKPATTPNQPPDGQPDPTPSPAGRTPWKPPPPPGTPTAPPHRPCPGPDPTPHPPQHDFDDSSRPRPNWCVRDVLVAARRIYQATGFQLLDEEPHPGFGHAVVAQTWQRER